jgi:ABC-type multidrug transport system fused ATPase/permease subunit
MTLVAALPNIQAVMSSKVVGKLLFDVIDRVPTVTDHDDSKPFNDIKETIRFRDVTFRYPTAPPEIRNVLEKVNFEIKAG